MRLFLTEAGYGKALENQEKGFIKIRNHAKVRGGDLLYDRRDRELYGLKNVSKEVGNPLFFLL